MNKIGFVALPAPSKPRVLAEGEKPYILIRLEYLEIVLNAIVGTSISLEGLVGHFKAISPDNKIIITCTYHSGVESERIENLILLWRNY